MASVVGSSNMPVINKTFSNIKEKMVELNKQIRATEERTQATKMAAREQFSRERVAVNKQYAIRDQMQIIDARTDKIETKIEYVKERLFVASRRYEENVKMSQSLEDNRIDVLSFDDRINSAKDRLRVISEDMAIKKRKADALKLKIEVAEKRELKAKIRIDHFEEIQRSREQTKCTESLNYKPKTDQEYLEEISELRARLSEAVRKFQTKEAKQAALEKREIEIEAQIEYTKKKVLSVKQAQHEMLGTKI